MAPTAHKRRNGRNGRCPVNLVGAIHNAASRAAAPAVSESSGSDESENKAVPFPP
jgi:hypothetical protein